MANYADMAMLSSIVIYPVVAGKAAVSAGAGLSAVLFVTGAIAIAAAVIWLGSILIYSVVDLVPDSDLVGWKKWVFGVPLSLFHEFLWMLAPVVITAIGAGATWLGTTWLVGRMG